MLRYVKNPRPLEEEFFAGLVLFVHLISGTVLAVEGCWMSR